MISPDSAILGILDKKRVAATQTSVRERVLSAGISDSLVLVGSAKLAEKCVEAIRLLGGRVSFLVDYDAKYWGATVAGLPVRSPNEAARLSQPGTLFVSAVWSPNHSFLATKMWLETFGITNVLPVQSIFWAAGERIAPHYQLCSPNYLVDAADEVASISARLSDTESREQFHGHLEWRVTLNERFLPVRNRHRMYFDRRMYRLASDAVIADAGAFDGDTLQQFLYAVGDDFSEYHAFEPDQVSCRRLQSYCDQLPTSVSQRVRVRNCAISSKPELITVASTGKAGSRPGGEGAERIEAITLDDYFGGGRVSFVKCDIEGAEAEALEGAWTTIERHRPVLAIAIYHRPSDIFELPKLIISRTPNYSYFVRSHDHDGIDLVFYAVPDELKAPGI